MSSPRTIECALPAGLRRSRRPARQSRVAVGPGRVPRVSRLLALALRLDGLVRAGAIADYATLARLGHVSRARVSQVLSLLLLAPDIQETLLFPPPTERGRDPIRLRQLQALAALPDWRHQRRRWQELRSATGLGAARPPVGE
jgi:integrase